MAVVLEKRKAERDALAQGRVDLAAALRLAVRFGFNEGIDNHFSLMVPGTTDPYTVVVSNLGPSDVTGATVSDLVPAGATAATWTVTANSGGGAQ